MKALTAMIILACAGCAGTGAGQVELQGSQWVLAELEGEPVTPVGERGAGFLRFEGNSDRFAASAGCNSMGGKWTVDGETLTFSQVVSTLMACQEPLMTRERQLSEALSGTTTFRSREGRLELVAGSRVVATFTSGGAQ
jgi:heat shock protein HslJ